MKSTSIERTAAQDGRRHERGVALITVMMVMVLLVLLALGAIDSAEQELRAGGQSRAVGNSLYGAEAGVEFAMNRLNRSRDLSAFTFTLDGTTIQSRSRDEAAAQPIEAGGLGKPPPGYSINVGSGYVSEVFQINVTAGGGTRPATSLEVKLGFLTPN